MFILEALGYPRPVYAHLPFVAEPGSRNKLSKRKLDKYLKNRDFAQMVEHGRKIAEAIGHAVEADAFNPVIVDFYQTVGYLPEAIINYLALLGWSLDDKTRAFFAAGIDREVFAGAGEQGPGQFRSQEACGLRGLALPATCRWSGKWRWRRRFWKRPGWSQSPASRPSSGRSIEKVIAAAGDRIKVAGDILRSPISSRRRSVDLRRTGLRQTSPPGRGSRVAAEVPRPAGGRRTVRRADLEAMMQQFVAAEQIKIGQMIHPVRVAVTGKSIGLGLFDTLAILGRERCLRRIERVLARIAS